MNRKTVYILGAGCSKSCGYPLAKDFLAGLDDYGATLEKREKCERLRQCVLGVAKLMREYGAPTIDRLALQIYEGLQLQERQHLSTDIVARNRLEKSALEKILDSKIATVAMFFEQERNVRQTGLTGYRDFLSIVFDGRRDRDVLETTSNRILSFNYDRVFETAFCDHFGLDHRNMDIYASPWLNSGLSFMDKQAVKIVPDRFSFLKLHGTAGMRVAGQPKEARYGQTGFLDAASRMIDDNFFWPQVQASPQPQRTLPEPLIVFPIEKDRSRERHTAFPYDKYIQDVWDQAMKLAEEADQLWVIGYSFDPNDRKSVLELLRRNKSDCDIVVQNPAAHEICSELGLRYRDLAPRLKPLPNPF